MKPEYSLLEKLLAAWLIIIILLAIMTHSGV
jgi:hypothetical protein